jgi:acyl-CoA hydrolase
LYKQGQKNLSQKAYLINEAYFTFVALDDNVSSTIVPSIKTTSEAEKKEFANALTRKNNRIKK